MLRHSFELFFRQRMPWRLGMVRLDCGPIVVAHLHGDCPRAPARVRVRASLDRAGQAVLIAIPEKDTPHMTDDRQLREMTCDPKFRKVLITDAKTATGQALVEAVVAAGADLVWAGYAEPWKKPPGFERLASIPQVSLLALDLTNSRSVHDIAGEIGGRVDILINTADYHRNYGIAARNGVEVARAEMDTNYFGLLRLAQEFAPAMRARGADGQSSAVAWVNLLSIFALSNFPPHGTYSASKAAALSLAQCLRAELAPAGIRLINIFPGPIDDEWSEALLPPKIVPARLAAAIVDALRDGAEDVFPGEVAQDWLARWRDNPKVLERELAASI
jgi:NAD(P)-dependent dehydrogenase (short-subunit alcohol dehydrogenase family)